MDRNGYYAQMLARAQRHHVPISVLAELTHACNVDCEHCYLDLVPDKKIGALSTAEWKRVFDELAAAGCLFLTLSGGELLMRPDWYELACYGRSLGFALRLFTNGVMITDAVADQIAALDPLKVEISLHGASAATQDAITRRPGSFDKTLRGARALVARGVPLKLKAVIMQRNYREYGAIRALAGELGAECYFDVEVTPKNNGSLEPFDLNVDQAELLEVARDIWGLKSSCAHGDATDMTALLDSEPCSAGRRTCHIGPTGDLFACTQWPSPVGSLRTTSFRELWETAPEFQQIRGLRVRDLEGCAGCGALAVCNPCMALSVMEYGDLAGPSDTKCRTGEVRARVAGLDAKPAGRPGMPRAGAGAQLVQIRRRQTFPTPRSRATG